MWRLFWPKSRCFDYLYRDAEILLRNYPVQATICPFAESSSDEEDDDGNEEEEEEERVEKEQNWILTFETFGIKPGFGVVIFIIISYLCKYMYRALISTSSIA